MLNAYSVRMTSCELRSEKAAILEEVLSIKFFFKHYFSIFTITHFKNPNMAAIMLALSEYQTVALSPLALAKVQI